MAGATAIVIGVGEGPALERYNLEPLPYAEPSARQIACFAAAEGYAPVTKLIGCDATLPNVETALERVTCADPPWDTVLIVFSGHGYRKDSGRLCDDNSLDEHWCLHDQLLVDDHLLYYTQKFKSTTRLFIVADCCFAAEGSGYVGLTFDRLIQAMSKKVSGWAARRRKLWQVDASWRRRALLDFDCSPPTAKVLLLGASGSDMAEAHKFMCAFLLAWNEPGARASFRSFRDRVAHHGGKPVLKLLWSSDAQLLDAPAFVP